MVISAKSSWLGKGIKIFKGIWKLNADTDLDSFKAKKVNYVYD